MSALTAPQASQVGGEVEDSELVRRVRRDDERAFEILYHRYHRRITAYIFGMVHDHGRAEDISQDVFVSALRRMRETDRPIAFKPWIYEIAKNACIDQFRRSRRAEEVSYDADEGMGAADYGRLVSSDAIPEAQLESKTQLDHLRGAFGGLSETHHEILVMRELEGLSYREIGERLGMTRPSVESTLFRARKRLTEEYEELVTGARCQRIQGIISSAGAGEVGLRDQRRLARHVSHCQPCRRQARMAGLDVPVTSDRPIRQRIAAMLPLPLFLRRRWLGGDSDSAAGAPSQLSSFAHFSAQLGSTFDPSWVKAAATAATVAVAGVGAGIAANQAPTAFGPSVTPVNDSRSGVHDERAARSAGAPSATTAVASSPTSAATPGRSARRTTTTATSSSSPAGTTTSPASPATATAPSASDQVAAAVPKAADEVTGKLPSVPSASRPESGGPSPSSAPSLPAVPSAPTVSTPVSAPDPAATLNHATDTLTGATKDTTKTVTGIAGSG